MKLSSRYLLVVSLFSWVSVVSQGQPYGVLGDTSRLESALTSMGLQNQKVKRFAHLGGWKVNLTEEQAAKLEALLGPGSVQRDEVFQAFRDVEVGGKPSGGAGGVGQVVPWGITAVRAPSAWAYSRGAGVAVCIVDTGLDQDHPDLAANIAGGANYITGGSWDDDNGHGTHVGGTIAALDNTIGVVGVAPEAKLLGAKVFDRRGAGSYLDVADGILGCVSLRDSYMPGAPLVINMSFQEGDQPLIHSAIQTVKAQGAVPVAMAGNYPGGLTYPGRYDEVITITGVDSNLNFWAQGGSSGPGQRLPDFTAPAVAVLSLTKRGGTQELTGNSMSCAHSSGVMALVLSSGSLGPMGIDLGFPATQQGQGLIDALLSVTHF